MSKIEKTDAWSTDLVIRVLQNIEKENIYMTNIVKSTGTDATLPDAEKIRIFLPILVREIEILKPKYIVTFGLIPFENLAGKKIRLDDYYREAMKKHKLTYYEADVGSLKAKIIPCYFPVGRGNPKRAVELLKMIKNEYNLCRFVHEKHIKRLLK